MVKKQSNIRITKKDKELYKSLTNKAKDKIRRVTKKYGNTFVGVDDQGNPFVSTIDKAVDLPKITDFKTRADFNDWKEKVQSFTKRTNRNFQFTKLPDGTVGTEKAVKQYLKDNQTTIDRAEKLIQHFADKPYAGGRALYGHILAQMGKPEVAGITVPEKADLNKIKGVWDLERKISSAHNRAREDYYDWRTGIMQDNLIGVIEKAFNSDANDVIKRLKALSPSDFLEMYLFNKSTFGFELFYSNQGIITDENADLEAMRSAVEDFKSGKDDIDWGKSFGNKERW